MNEAAPERYWSLNRGPDPWPAMQIEKDGDD